jgi:hypothetical protein
MAILVDQTARDTLSRGHQFAWAGVKDRAVGKRAGHRPKALLHTFEWAGPRGLEAILDPPFPGVTLLAWTMTFGEESAGFPFLG